MVVSDMSLGRKHRRPPDPVDQMPKTVSEAVDRLLITMTAEEIALIQGMKKVEMIRSNRIWGQCIRNGFGLWGANQALISSLPPEQRWTDNASAFIMEAV